MDRTKIWIILGTAHLDTTPGKCSPDGKLREAVWSREFCSDLKPKLESYGLNVLIDYLPLQPCKEMGKTTTGELKWRTDFVNQEAKKYGRTNTFYISTHLNAAGNQGKWMNARGWSAYTSPGKTTSDLLAQFMYTAAESGLKEYKKTGTWIKPQKPIRSDYSDGDPDMESNLYVLKNTICPAVLVENMFQDNRDDASYLMSDLGKHELQRLYVEGILWFLDYKSL